MKIVLRFQILAVAALFTACGPPELLAIPDNPYSNDDSAVVHQGALTLVASRNTWYERALSEVSTPVDLMIVNRSKQTLPITLEGLELVDERGRVYRALPSQEVVSRLFGGAPPPPESYMEPVPMQSPTPESQEPMQEPPPEPQGGVKSPPASGTSPSQTLAPTLDPGIVLVAGHGGGHAGGGGRGGAVGGQHFAGHGFYGGRGYYGYGFGGRFGYPYRGYRPWGWGGVGGWGWGWGFGPAYVIGLDADDYYYPGYDPRELDHLGPWQVYQVALRPTELKPNQRMGGLVFFEPAWNAKLLTLRFTTQPEGGAPVQMSARFEVR